MVRHLLLLFLAAAAAASASAAWTSLQQDCAAVAPGAAFGAAAPDLKTAITVTTADGGAVAALCPGVAYTVRVKFPERRNFIVAATAGAFSGGVATTGTCANRFISAVPASTTAATLSLPCGAAGTVDLAAASVLFNKTTSAAFKKAQLLGLPVAPLAACPQSNCPGAGLRITTGVAATPAAAPAAAPADALGVRLPAIPGLKLPEVRLNLTKTPFKVPSFKVNLTKVALPTKVVLDLNVPQLESMKALLTESLSSVDAAAGLPDLTPLAQPFTALQSLAASMGVAAPINLTAGLASAPGAALAAAAATVQGVSAKLLRSANVTVATNGTVLGLPDSPDELVAFMRGIADELRAKTAGLFGAGAGADAADAPAGDASARRLLAADPVASYNARKIVSFTQLAQSDFWAVMYTGFKTSRAAMALMIAALKAPVNGVVTLDNVSLLDFTSNVASLGAELSDLMSRITKTTSDAINPLNLKPTTTGRRRPASSGPATCSYASGATLRVATVGDFGVNDENEAKVATMIGNWKPDHVLALGDNNYDVGAAATIDANVGKFYASFISPYTGNYGPGAPGGVNRFWPILGNHDWGNTCGDQKSGCAAGVNCFGGDTAGYAAYMPIQGKRYYSQLLGADGLLEIFALDSDCNEPDGTGADSAQATWLRGALAASKAAWKFVLLHHAPFSSSSGHGSINRVQWPYAEWGADAVFSGHDHLYERVLQGGGFPYFVNGAGGRGLNAFLPNPVAGSAARYAEEHGAQLITLNATRVELAFWATTYPGPSLIDCYAITRPAPGAAPSYGTCAAADGPGPSPAPAPGPAPGPSPSPSPAPGPTPPPLLYSLLTGAAAPPGAPGGATRVAWRWRSQLSALPDGWQAPGFAAGRGWRSARASLGYGPDQPWITRLPSADAALHHYFRTSFCLGPDRAAAAARAGVVLRVLADNGADVWVNGARVLSDGGANHDPAYWNNELTLQADALVAGANTIAVHVSNTPGSSDAGFDLDLLTYAESALGEPPAAPRLGHTVLTGSPATPATVRLSWAPPACGGGDAVNALVSRYRVSITPGGRTVNVKVNNPFASLARLVTGLASCTEYTFSVVALIGSVAGEAASVTLKTPGC
ncbi:hypothetical protein HT031_002717 [Scenedesmus sp. PABB004]|nr:hypothetical protein HT031_002717 [Scenedesmus sp. PABB004]